MAYLEAVGLTKIYRQGERQTTALRNVSFSVEQGEMVAIGGRARSGKSTLMNLRGCLDLPTAGEYRLGGQDMANCRCGNWPPCATARSALSFSSFT